MWSNRVEFYNIPVRHLNPIGNPVITSSKIKTLLKSQVNLLTIWRKSFSRFYNSHICGNRFYNYGSNFIAMPFKKIFKGIHIVIMECFWFDL